jgi:hypothetical protein
MFALLLMQRREIKKVDGGNDVRRLSDCARNDPRQSYWSYNRCCMEREEPSHDTFVIHAEDKSSIAELNQRLHQLGSTKALEGHEGGVVLQLHQTGEEPRFAWQAIQKVVGENIGVHPVLLDAEGSAHYPTGRINVRFVHTPDQQEVEQFARIHNLETRSANKFIPAQFVFEPLESSKRYLPDVLKQIRSEESVKAAWADTLSRYERV